jgi:uridine phosphorylase
VLRLGSCGALMDLPVGTVVVPKYSVAVSRNVDFDFLDPDDCPEPAYRISKQVGHYTAYPLLYSYSVGTCRPYPSP